MRAIWIPCVIVGAVATTVSAQPAPDAALAERLFEEGRGLVERGRAGEACPKFEESLRLDPGRGTLLNLAACYEAVGKLATALRTFRDVVVQARAAGDRRRLDAAAARAAELETRVPRLELRLGDGARPPGFVMTLDGSPISQAEAGDLMVDPGQVVVAATAPGYRAFETRVTLQPDGGRTIITVPVLAPEPDVEPTSVRIVPGVSAPARTARRAPVGLAIAGGGAVLAAGAAGLALSARASYRDAIATHCGGDARACTLPGLAAAAAARGRGDLATVGGVVAGLAVAGGVALWWHGRRRDSRRAREPRAAIVPVVSPGQAALVLRGGF